MTAVHSFWWDEADAEDLAQELAEAEARDDADRALRREHEAQLDAAAADVQRANDAYELARQRLRCAPHGETGNRRRDLRVANARVLGAELRYAELQQDR